MKTNKYPSHYNCYVKQTLLIPEIFDNTNVHFVWFCCSMPHIREEIKINQKLKLDLVWKD